MNYYDDDEEYLTITMENTKFLDFDDDDEGLTSFQANMLNDEEKRLIQFCMLVLISSWDINDLDSVEVVDKKKNERLSLEVWFNGEMVPVDLVKVDEKLYAIGNEYGSNDEIAGFVKVLF